MIRSPNDNNRKSKEREVAGVLIMAISGGLAFFLILPLGTITDFLRSFFIGIMGWFTIAALAGTFVAGLMMLLRKSVTLHPKYIAGIAIIAFCSLVVLQLITSFGLTDAYGERLLNVGFGAYMRGVFGGNTAGGALFGIFAFIMGSFLGLPISIGILIFAIAFSSLLFVDISKVKAWRVTRGKEKRAESFFAGNDNNFQKGQVAQPIAPQNRNGLYIANIVPPVETPQSKNKKNQTSWPKLQTVTSFGVNKKGFFDRDTEDTSMSIKKGGGLYSNGVNSVEQDESKVGKSSAFNALYGEQFASLKKADESIIDGKSMLIFPNSVVTSPHGNSPPSNSSSILTSPSYYSPPSSLYSSLKEPPPDHIINSPPKILHGIPTGLRDVVVPADKGFVDSYEPGMILNGDAFSLQREEPTAYQNTPPRKVSDEQSLRNEQKYKEDMSIIKSEDFGGAVMPGFMAAQTISGSSYGSSTFTPTQSAISAYGVDYDAQDDNQTPIVNGDGWQRLPISPSKVNEPVIKSQATFPQEPLRQSVKIPPIVVADTPVVETVEDSSKKVLPPIVVASPEKEEKPTPMPKEPELPPIVTAPVDMGPVDVKKIRTTEDNLFDLIYKDKLSRDYSDGDGLVTDYEEDDSPFKEEKDNNFFCDNEKEEAIIDKTEYDAPVVSMEFDKTGEYNIVEPEDSLGSPKKDFKPIIKPVRSKTQANPNQISLEKVLKDNATSIIGSAPPKPRIPKKKYIAPPLELLIPKGIDSRRSEEARHEMERMLEGALAEFGVPVKVFNSVEGSSVTRFELEIIKSQDKKSFSVKDVEKYADDLAYSMASKGAIRIEAPIPGRKAIGIEIPNQERAPVGLRAVIESRAFNSAKSPLTLALGEDISGTKILCNLIEMPHLLVAGSTGSGKSVCLNSIITSILYKASPEDVRLILVDPKRVEFTAFKGLPHMLLENAITEPEQAINAFSWAIAEMDRRYMLLASHEAKNISDYNSSDAVKSGEAEKIPYIVIIVDELAYLMDVSKREMEEKIRRITSLARAAGIHLVLATQRPSVDVITGTIKVNLPSRVAFAVTNAHDSKTILDQPGAETLLGRGDMLYAPQDQPEPARVQGAFITNEEVTAIANFVRENNVCYYDDTVKEAICVVKQEPVGEIASNEDVDYDPLLADVARRIIESGQASSSMVMRRFSVGYARAARIIDQLQERGIIGPPDGSKPREVFITSDMFEDAFGEEF